MPSYADVREKRFLDVITPLRNVPFTLTQFQGIERISEPFDYRLYLLTPDKETDIRELMDSRITVKINDGITQKTFNGICSEIVLKGVTAEGLVRYEIKLVPWFWYLKMDSNCRIFQGQTVLEIFRKICLEKCFVDYDLSHCRQKDLPKKEYCVQYDETTFDFLDRILAQEGMGYYFTHDETKHTMVLTDSPLSFSTIKESIPYSQAKDHEPHIDRWMIGARIRARQFELKDYDYEYSSAPMSTKTQTPLVPGKKQRINRQIDTRYPGQYQTIEEGERQVERMKRLKKNSETTCEGTSNSLEFSAGRIFSLIQHPHPKDNTSYLLTRVEHEAYDRTALLADHETHEDTPPQVYTNRFAGIPETHVYQPEKLFHLPEVYGVETAEVVGAQKGKLHTDRYGRVQVKFFWDRYYPQETPQEPIWIRVVQPLAGEGRGMQFLPRVGHEVIVDFENGDPNRPIIIGSLHNADNLPPYDYPKEQTKSGIKTRTIGSQDPKLGNEIQFDDKKGEEKLTIHASKDYHLSVAKDQTIMIEGDLKEHIKGDQHLYAYKSHTIASNKAIRLTGGKGQIIMTPHNITIKGPSIELGDPGTETPMPEFGLKPIIRKTPALSTPPEKSKQSEDTPNNDDRQTYWVKLCYPKPDQALPIAPRNFKVNTHRPEDSSTKTQSNTGELNDKAHGKIILELDEQIKEISIDQTEVLSIGTHKNLYPYDRIDAKNDDCIAANEQELSGEKLKPQDKLLNIAVLPPPIIVNLREDRPENTPNRLTDDQVQYVKNHGNNATIFIHGFNVAFGQYDHHFSYLAPSNQNDVSFYPELDIIQSPTPCTIYRNHSMLKKQFPDIADLDEAHYPLQYRDFTDTPLNGIEAHNWFVHMEDNLNGATGQFDRSDYSQYTRLIHVAWSGDVGKACYLQSEDKADAAGERLVDLIEQLHQEKIEINIIAHSMGNRVLLKMMDILGAKGKEDWIEHVFMCEAAVPQNALSNNPKLDISVKQNSHFIHAHQAAKKITVLYSQQDSVVGWIYRFVNHGVDINQINHSKNYGPMEKRHDTERFGYYASRMRNLLANPNSANLWHTVEPPTVDREHLAAVENLMGEMNRNLKISATIRPALGHEGPDMSDTFVANHLYKSGKLILANTTPWIKSHSAMKIPTPEIMKNVYEYYIMNKTRGIKKLGLLEVLSS